MPMPSQLGVAQIGSSIWECMCWHMVSDVTITTCYYTLIINLYMANLTKVIILLSIFHEGKSVVKYLLMFFSPNGQSNYTAFEGGKE